MCIWSTFDNIVWSLQQRCQALCINHDTFMNLSDFHWSFDLVFSLHRWKCSLDILPLTSWSLRFYEIIISVGFCILVWKLEEIKRFFNFFEIGGRERKKNGARERQSRRRERGEHRDELRKIFWNDGTRTFICCFH